MMEMYDIRVVGTWKNNVDLTASLLHGVRTTDTIKSSPVWVSAGFLLSPGIVKTSFQAYPSSLLLSSPFNTDHTIPCFGILLTIWTKVIW